MLLTTLVAGEDFGAVLTSSEDLTGDTLTCVLVDPSGDEIEIDGTVAVDGFSATFTALGSATASWQTGSKWTGAIWRSLGGGSRDHLLEFSMRVLAPKGSVP